MWEYPASFFYSAATAEEAKFREEAGEPTQILDLKREGEARTFLYAPQALNGFWYHLAHNGRYCWSVLCSLQVRGACRKRVARNYLWNGWTARTRSCEWSHAIVAIVWMGCRTARWRFRVQRLGIFSSLCLSAVQHCPRHCLYLDCSPASSEPPGEKANAWW